MANIHYLQRNVFEWLEPIVTLIGFDANTNITWAHENADRPDLTHWLVLNITKIKNSPNNEVRLKPNKDDLNKLDEVVYKRSQVTLRINIYGEDSVTIANYIQQYMSLDSNIENAGRLGIGYVATSDTQDLSELISGKYKSRALFEIVFNHTDRIGDSSVVEPQPLIPSLPSVTQIDTSIDTIGKVTIIGDDDKANEIINTTLIEP